VTCILVCVQLGGIIAANIYRNDDKPYYHRGNRTLLGINVLSISLFLFAKGYYVFKNRIRDKKWKALTPEVCFPTSSHNSLVPLERRPKHIFYIRKTHKNCYMLTNTVYSNVSTTHIILPTKPVDVLTSGLPIK
jgi:hypothetical protein